MCSTFFWPGWISFLSKQLARRARSFIREIARLGENLVEALNTSCSSLKCYVSHCLQYCGESLDDASRPLLRASIHTSPRFRSENKLSNIPSQPPTMSRGADKSTSKCNAFRETFQTRSQYMAFCRLQGFIHGNCEQGTSLYYGLLRAGISFPLRTHHTQS